MTRSVPRSVPHLSHPNPRFEGKQGDEARNGKDREQISDMLCTIDTIDDPRPRRVLVPVGPGVVPRELATPDVRIHGDVLSVITGIVGREDGTVITLGKARDQSGFSVIVVVIYLVLGEQAPLRDAARVCDVLARPSVGGRDEAPVKTATADFEKGSVVADAA